MFLEESHFISRKNIKCQFALPTSIHVECRYVCLKRMHLPNLHYPLKSYFKIIEAAELMYLLI